MSKERELIIKREGRKAAHKEFIKKLDKVKSVDPMTDEEVIKLIKDSQKDISYTEEELESISNTDFTFDRDSVNKFEDLPEEIIKWILKHKRNLYYTDDEIVELLKCGYLP